MGHLDNKKALVGLISPEYIFRNMLELLGNFKNCLLLYNRKLQDFSIRGLRLGNLYLVIPQELIDENALLD